MSVYTSFSDEEFSAILKNYPLGEFISAQGIQAGIENTNYFVTTTKGEVVFTLFEKINIDELEVYVSLLQELSTAKIACPQPQSDFNQHFINETKTKPFTFVTRLKGKSLTVVNSRQVEALATELAKLHTAPLLTSSPVSPLLKNRRGKAWREKSAKNLIKKLSNSDAKLLSSELEYYKSFDDTQLPKGIIHADLFRDNALFENDQLSGIIDFYDACFDSYLYDIAITVNDWCTDESGNIKHTFARTFLQSYQSIRPLTIDEKKAWPIMLRIAAMRFWLSRLEDSFTQQTGELTQSKKPSIYKQILQKHAQNPTPFDTLLACG